MARLNPRRRQTKALMQAIDKVAAARASLVRPTGKYANSGKRYELAIHAPGHDPRQWEMANKPDLRTKADKLKYRGRIIAPSLV